MKSNFNNSIELLKIAQKELLYKNLLQQIKKDFGLANVELDFPLDIAAEKLKDLLREKIYFLIMERFQEYLNLLYVVDIPEKKVKEISALDAVEVSGEVCFLILKREWEKVWYKRQYGS